jgi:toxin ParE1/3/4
VSGPSSARNYGFFPSAGVEFVEAIEHYAAEDHERAMRFEAAVTHAIGRILEYPEIGPVIRRREGVAYRTLRVQRFRYSVVYTVIDDDLRIYAVAHHSRRPGYWLARVRIR